MNNVVSIEYKNIQVIFDEDGWINATDLAEKHGRRLDNWLRNQETEDYIAALCEISNTSKVRYLKTKRGNKGDLDLLAKLEQLDTVLIGCGTDYDTRKVELGKYAAEQRRPMIAA